MRNNEFNSRGLVYLILLCNLNFCTENPISEEDEHEYRLEVYLQLGQDIQLERLDKEPFSPEEIEEAEELKEQRKLEQVIKMTFSLTQAGCWGVKGPIVLSVC